MRTQLPPLRGTAASKAPSKNSTHSERISTTENPSCRAARSIISVMWLTWVAWLRATKVAPLLSSVRIGLMGWSMAPQGSVLDLKPSGEVGDVCFFVRP